MLQSGPHSTSSLTHHGRKVNCLFAVDHHFVQSADGSCFPPILSVRAVPNCFCDVREIVFTRASVTRTFLGRLLMSWGLLLSVVGRLFSSSVVCLCGYLSDDGCSGCSGLGEDALRTLWRRERCCSTTSSGDSIGRLQMWLNIVDGQGAFETS